MGFLEQLNAQNHHQKSIEKYQAGNIDEALIEINKAIENQPDNAEYYNFRAFLLSKLDRTEEMDFDFKIKYDGSESMLKFEIIKEDLDIVKYYIFAPPIYQKELKSSILNS